jgi:hypothetical protein
VLDGGESAADRVRPEASRVGRRDIERACEEQAAEEHGCRAGTAHMYWILYGLGALFPRGWLGRSMKGSAVDVALIGRGGIAGVSAAVGSQVLRVYGDPVEKAVLEGGWGYWLTG